MVVYLRRGNFYRLHRTQEANVRIDYRWVGAAPSCLSPTEGTFETIPWSEADVSFIASWQMFAVVVTIRIFKWLSQDRNC